MLHTFTLKTIDGKRIGEFDIISSHPIPSGQEVVNRIVEMGKNPLLYYWEAGPSVRKL